MTTTERPAVYLPPGAGAAVWLVGDTYTLKLDGEQTGGAFSLSEAIVPPDGGPPPHIHFAEDETFVVLEGELELAVADRPLPAPAGTVLCVPKGTVTPSATWARCLRACCSSIRASTRARPATASG